MRIIKDGLNMQSKILSCVVLSFLIGACSSMDAPIPQDETKIQATLSKLESRKSPSFHVNDPNIFNEPLFVSVGEVIFEVRSSVVGTSSGFRLKDFERINVVTEKGRSVSLNPDSFLYSEYDAVINGRRYSISCLLDCLKKPGYVAIGTDGGVLAPIFRIENNQAGEMSLISVGDSLLTKVNLEPYKVTEPLSNATRTIYTLLEVEQNGERVLAIIELSRYNSERVLVQSAKRRVPLGASVSCGPTCRIVFASWTDKATFVVEGSLN